MPANENARRSATSGAVKPPKATDSKSMSMKPKTDDDGYWAIMEAIARNFPWNKFSSISELYKYPFSVERSILTGQINAVLDTYRDGIGVGQFSDKFASFWL